ncbi:MAG: RagB/SusD family nutrient uptake outer membrane protein [Porphyromonas sp.]|nr:RagB/SusD family nutrient uptake outer membrane protein [Porphyromonas sp.]
MKLKNILKSTLALGLLVAGMSSCDMNTPMYYFSDPATPKTVQDVQNVVNGAYNQFAGYRFYGRNVVALGDIATDIATASPSKGHFVAIDQWTFNETEGVLDEIWKSGYVVIGSCTDAINQANALLAEANTSDDEKAQLQSLIMQAAGLKAYTYYAMINIFGKDVATNGNTPGLILVKEEKPAPKVEVERASVSEVYSYILDLLKQAHAAAAAAGEAAYMEPYQYYISPVALDAMEAKIKLSLHDYAGAKAAATKALQSSKDISNKDYLAMWSSTAPSAEDIFTLVKSEDDNLSANALNTLYGSYLASLNSLVLDVMKDTDARSGLIQMTKADDEAIQLPHPTKYNGTPSAAAVSNIPVLRYSDMYLTLAEAEANLGNLAAASTALLNVAKRDSEVNATTFTAYGKAELLQFIAEERVREFFVEGHRLMDLKRTGAPATINGKQGYVISGFAFPIPASEINAGFMTQQNDDWSTLIP